MNTMTETKVRLIASPKAWIEGEALRQFYAASKLEGVRLAVGFPDLHPGKGGPVGAAFVTEHVIYPQLIGSDIGCGMALWKTDLLRRKAKLERWAELRFDLEQPWEGNVGGWLQDNRLPSTEFDQAMGTIGGGNHFAELQAVERVHNAEAFDRLGLDREALVGLVHSGSRGFGKSILWHYAAEQRAIGAVPDAGPGSTYLQAHNTAVRWARANRELIASRFLGALGAEAERVWDACHNSITPVPASSYEGESTGVRGAVGTMEFLHRKGAVPAEDGPLVIPGSRGALTYLVQPTGDGESHAWSLAHGAGRKWSRCESRQRARERFQVQELVQTALGGRVVCESRDLLYEEAPMAYKPIETVIEVLEQAGLAEVVATFRPLLTYKTRAIRR